MHYVVLDKMDREVILNTERFHANRTFSLSGGNTVVHTLFAYGMAAYLNDGVLERSVTMAESNSLFVQVSKNTHTLQDMGDLPSIVQAHRWSLNLPSSSTPRSSSFGLRA